MNQLSKPKQNNTSRQANSLESQDITLDESQMEEVYATLREEANFTELIRKESTSNNKKKNNPKSDHSVVFRKPTKTNFTIEILFIISFLLAMIGFIYSKNEQIARAFPQFAEVISMYVEFINNTKLTLIGN